MIFTYNKKYVGDVLMVIVKDSQNSKLDYERKGNVARIFLEKTKETVAWNIFDVSHVISIDGSGQIDLSNQEVAILNDFLITEGFTEQLENDLTPKFVVGEIKELTPHPDSDHLNICQVQISDDKSIQIVAGAPNVAISLKTIVALSGAMLPNGKLIFSGSLRGKKSFGMMCSPRELALPNAPQKRGIIELDDDAIIGEPFNPEKHWKY